MNFTASTGESNSRLREDPMDQNSMEGIHRGRWHDDAPPPGITGESSINAQRHLIWKKLTLGTPAPLRHVSSLSEFPDRLNTLLPNPYIVDSYYREALC